LIAGATQRPFYEVNKCREAPMKRWSAVLILTAGTLALAGPAPSADKPSKAKRAAALQAVVDCRPITDSGARLACYDAAAAKLDEAEAKGQVVVVDREQARQVRKEVFGLQLPSLDIFNLGGGGKGVAQGEDVDRITATVKQAWRSGDGKWVVELDTGAVWRQLEDGDLARDPHPGSKAEIRKASLGSFFLKLDGQPAFKAHRDR
jgi:hypothetical protein